MTSWTYDAKGRELSRKLPDGELENYTYNVYEQTATHVDFDGNTATYGYYSNYSGGGYAGAIEQIVFTGASGSGKATETVGYTYDEFGRQKTIVDSAETNSADPTGTTTNTYDTQGNLYEQQTPEGTIWYVFDPTTGEHTETYTSFTETDYGYNTEGQLVSTTIRELNGSTLTTPLVTSYSYDGVGNKVTETLPDGEISRYAYDSLNRLVSMNESQGTTTLFSEMFILNDDGARHSASESQLQSDNSTTSTLNYTWGYDADGRLLSEVLSSSNTALNYSDTYTFDLNSNAVTDAHTGAGGTAGTATNYYNGDDQLMNSSIGSTVTQYGYDPNGSQISVTVNGTTTTTYGYDVRNRMIAYNGSGGSATYVYGDAGNRVAETSGGNTTFYLTDIGNPGGYAQPLEEHRNSTTSAPSRTYFLGDRVFGEYNTSSSSYASSAIVYLLNEGRGSIEQYTNSAGAISNSVSYTTYGTALGFDPAAIGGAYFFGGDAVYDPVSGLYLHGDGIRPRLGIMFLQADSEGNSLNSDLVTLHRYLYAADDPANYSDPTGHFLTLADVLVRQSLAITLTSFVVVAAVATDITLNIVSTTYAVNGILNRLRYATEGTATATALETQTLKAKNKPYIEKKVKDEKYSRVLYHYTNEYSAIQILQTNVIFASPKYDGRLTGGFVFPAGAYATDLDPWNPLSTAAQLQSLFFAGNANKIIDWYVAVDGTYFYQPYPTHPLYKFQWLIPAPEGTPVPVHVITIGPT